MDDKQNKPNPFPMWKSALALGLVALMGTALLAGVDRLTRQRIEDQERKAVLQQLGQLIAPQRYNNMLQDDQYSFVDRAWFPSGQTITVFRAREDDQPVAAVFKMAATEGYNGKINLLIGINATGSLSGVRVTSHKETPGLGDGIELQRSDWVLGFDGRSLQIPQSDAWLVKRDGGEFDQLTGATITPRAIVKTVKMALDYFASNQELVFTQPAELSATEES